MERFMHQLSVLIAGTSIGLFLIFTYFINAEQRKIAESLSQKASITTVWAK